VSPPNPFPKTFNRILPPYRAHLKNDKFKLIWCAPYMGAKLILKVLGREFEGEPFFKRVSLNRHV